MAEAHDTWLEGIGVDVDSVLETAQNAVGGVDAVADISTAPSQGGEDESVVTVGGGVKVVGTGIKVAQTVGRFTAVAGAVGTGAAVGVGAVGFGVGVLAPAAIGFLLDRGEELQQQTDPDERSLPGGVPPPQSNPGGDGPSDGGAPPPAEPGVDRGGD